MDKQTTNAPIEVHVGRAIHTQAAPAALGNIQGVRGSVETSYPWLPLCVSHALFTPSHPTQADDNDDDKGFEMKLLVLVCAVVMLLRTVSGKCNLPSSCLPSCPSDDQDREMTQS